MTALVRLFRVDVPDAPAILVIHSWWGLTGSFHDYAASLSARGFHVGLADLFEGATATSPEQAAALRRRLRRIPYYKQLLAALDDLRRVTGAAKAGVVGFSMGGHWAVWLAQRPEARIGATVLYYATRAGDFSASSAAFLAHFAEDDRFVRPAARRRMENALAAAGRPYTALDYPGTGHWFAESAHRAFVPEAAALALRRDASFLHRALA